MHLWITSAAQIPTQRGKNGIMRDEGQQCQECIFPCRYTSITNMIKGVENWLGRYNSSRPHSFNRNKTPNQTEAEFYAKTSAINGNSGNLTGSN